MRRTCVVLLAFVCCAVPGAGLAAVVPELVRPAGQVAPVAPVTALFEAHLSVGGEDVTDQATFHWRFMPDGSPSSADGNPVKACFYTPGDDKQVYVTAAFAGGTYMTNYDFVAIGGMTSFQKDGVLIFLHEPEQSVTDTAKSRVGQPDGTTYEWAFTTGGDKAEFTSDPQQPAVIVSPVHSSTEEGDISVACTYSLDETSYTYGGPIMLNRGCRATSHKPTAPPSYQNATCAQALYPYDDDTHRLGHFGRPCPFYCASQFDRKMAGQKWCEYVWPAADSPWQFAPYWASVQIPDSGVVTDWYTQAPPYAGTHTPRAKAMQKVYVGGWHGQNTNTNPFWLTRIDHWEDPHVDIIPDPQ